MPEVAVIAVASIKSLPGGMKEALNALDLFPGTKLGRCGKCFTKVVLSKSTVDQLAKYPKHRPICDECLPKLNTRPAQMTREAVLDGLDQHLREGGKHGH